MTQTVILGADEALEQAWQVARVVCPGAFKLPLGSSDRYTYDLTPLLRDYSPAQTRVFVALDARALNYARHQLIAQVQLAGYRLLSLVSPQALVDDSVQLAGNVYVGPGCNLGPGCSLAPGCWLERQVVLASEVTLGMCVTLESAVVLGRGVSVGRGSTLGTASVALPGSRIGKRCEWLLGGTLPRELPDNALYDALMPEGARIFRY